MIAVLCIFGGEAWCVFGNRTPGIHRSCHQILYSGFTFFIIGSALHIGSTIKRS
jgi:hypothetical protein